MNLIYRVNQTFPALVVFGHGAYHSNRNHREGIGSLLLLITSGSHGVNSALEAGERMYALRTQGGARRLNARSKTAFDRKVLWECRCLLIGTGAS